MIVIPMAGESRRFKAAGYEAPKYMLPLLGRPLFDWAMLSFARYFASHPFLFVVRDVAGTFDFVTARTGVLGIANVHIVVLGVPTAGQAETVEIGLHDDGVAVESPLSIFNIDTIRPKIDLTAPPGTRSWLEAFRAPGDNWSFIELDPAEPARVQRCVEKVRISDLCCTGLYHFEAARMFTDALALERAAPSSHELFVAPLYTHLIARGQKIGWREADRKNVILSGVPAEYEALIAQVPTELVEMAR